MNHLTNIFIILSSLCLVAALILSFWRVLAGPSLPDKVLAFDLISILIMCFIGVYSFVSHNKIYLDIVLVIALLAFLSTVAFAQFIEWQMKSKKEEDHA